MITQFAQALRELMDECQINTATLSRETGISATAISYYLAGKREPCLTYLCLLADYFDVSLDVLTGKKLY